MTPDELAIENFLCMEDVAPSPNSIEPSEVDRLAADAARIFLPAVREQLGFGLVFLARFVAEVQLPWPGAVQHLIPEREAARVVLCCVILAESFVAQAV